MGSDEAEPAATGSGTTTVGAGTTATEDPKDCEEEDVNKCVDAYTTAIADMSAIATVCTAANTYYQCLKDVGCCSNDDQIKAIDDSISSMNTICTGPYVVSSKC